jgi:outer membrane protein OmpA-like peptidoglycan-associated protein
MRHLGVRAVCALAVLLWATACAGPTQAPHKFVVFFQEWSAALDDSAQSAVSGAAKWAQEHPNQNVTVSGYADPEGSQQANVAMSRARAQVVTDQLVRDGVNRQRIRVTAHGPTDFTLSSIESRRVEIAIGS